MWSSPAERTGVGGDGGVDPEAAREAARDILSGAEYVEPGPSPVERVADWLLDRLGSFFGTLTGGGPGSVIGWIVVLGLLTAAGLLILRSLRLPAGGRPSATDGLRYGTETRWDRTLWYEEAMRLAAQGDHRGALRCRHRALLATMVTAQVVEDVPGRTAAEYGAMLRARLPDTETDLRAVTDSFDRAWYGDEPVGADDLERFERACERIESAIDRSRPVPA